jgi:cold shock protein
MPSGRVKWFDALKGYGFIIPDDGSRDLFVHITAVQQAGYTSLVPGRRLKRWWYLAPIRAVVEELA